MTYLTFAIAIGFTADLIFGDPKKVPHPVVFMGKLISFLEHQVRRICGQSNRKLFYGGAVLFIIVAVVSFALPYFLILVIGKISPFLAFAAMCVMCWQIPAVKCLKDESMKVYFELEKGDIVSARKAVSMIVGRDTGSLTDEGVTKAAVETVAENTSDGIIAPFFYMAIGGPPLGFLYKAVNTMDSMIGYKNEKYMFMGKFAAKADDVFNFIPSRTAAIIMILSSFILRLNWKNAIKIFKRDRLKHHSPNSAQTESVCAGALEVSLAGDAYYFGRLVKKQTIGDPLRKICHDDIVTVNKMMYLSSFIMVFICLCLRILITAVIL